MRAKVSVFRFNRDEAAGPHYDEFFVDVTRGTTVLDCLTQIKDEQDGSLTFRSSCRVGACGDCATKINGQASLTCKTRALKELEEHGYIRVEPLPGFEVTRDLVVDLEPLWEHIEEIGPWIETREHGKRIPFELIEKVQRASFCNLCGICHSECPVVKADPGFGGPATLTKVYRFAIDDRDSRGVKRVVKLVGGSTSPFRCLRCYLCEEACPRSVGPAESTAALRRLAMRNGTIVEAGIRHARAMTKDVCRYGKLSETALAVRTWGYNPLAILRAIPLALRLWLRGKLVWRTEPIGGIQDIKKIIEATEKIQDG